VAGHLMAGAQRRLGVGVSLTQWAAADEGAVSRNQRAPHRIIDAAAPAPGPAHLSGARRGSFKSLAAL
jgi:hypothetical protein